MIHKRGFFEGLLKNKNFRFLRISQYWKKILFLKDFQGLKTRTFKEVIDAKEHDFLTNFRE